MFALIFKIKVLTNQTNNPNFQKDFLKASYLWLKKSHHMPTHVDLNKNALLQGVQMKII